jgi:antitoxin HicB
MLSQRVSSVLLLVSREFRSVIVVNMVAKTFTYSVVLETDEQAGGFVAHVPALPGCHTEGDTRDEAIAMAQDAITGYVQSLLAYNEPIPVEASPTGSLRIMATTSFSNPAPRELSKRSPNKPERRL